MTSKRPRWGGYRAQKLRAAWKPRIEAGDVLCYRCGQPILPGTRWDLDHTTAKLHLDSSDMFNPDLLHPSHAYCNRRHGQGIAAARRRPPGMPEGLTRAQRRKWREANGYPVKQPKPPAAGPQRPGPAARPAPDPFNWWVL